MSSSKGQLSSQYCNMTRRPKGALYWRTQIAFFSLSIIFLVSISATTALAAAGPHGSFTSSTEKCEQCHSLHTAKTRSLMHQSSMQQQCISCHSKGIGADTAVMEGAMMRPVEPGSTVYDNLGTLLGGGFNSVGAVNGTTSAHMMGYKTEPYGMYGGITYGFLDCLSCHTPHDGPNYRLLRRRPNESPSDILVGWNGPWQTTTTDAGGNTVVVEDRAYMDQSFGAGVVFDPVSRTYSGASHEVTRNYKNGLAAWCSACHSSYMIRRDTAPYDAGDAEGAVIRYRHAVDVPITGVTNEYIGAIKYDFQTDLPLEDTTGNGRTTDDRIVCLTCHRAHGTDALMTGRAVLASADDRGRLPSGEASMLLRLNNRQVCQNACHRVVR